MIQSILFSSILIAALVGVYAINNNASKPATPKVDLAQISAAATQEPTLPNEDLSTKKIEVFTTTVDAGVLSIEKQLEIVDDLSNKAELEQIALEDQKQKMKAALAAASSVNGIDLAPTLEYSNSLLNTFEQTQQALSENAKTFRDLKKLLHDTAIDNKEKVALIKEQVNDQIMRLKEQRMNLMAKVNDSKNQYEDQAAKLRDLREDNSIKMADAKQKAQDQKQLLKDRMEDQMQRLRDQRMK